MIQGFTEFKCTCGVAFAENEPQQAVDHVLAEHMRPKDRKSEDSTKVRVRVMIYPDPFVEGGKILESA